MRPVADLAACADAHAALLRSVERLTDADMRCPSSLSGWTIGHLCSHLARNADSHVRRFAAAPSGEVVDQYVGGREGRAAEIEAGAHRDAATIIADVRDTIAAFAAAADAVPDDAWDAVSRDATGMLRPASTLPWRRWQEAEVHHVDLGVGYTHSDWPDVFVARAWSELEPRLAERLPAGTPMPSFDGLSRREVLAWCYDRLALPDLPALTPYG